MDGNRSIKSKFRRKQSNRSDTPLLKPDMMLITKDVLVPVKLAPPRGKFFFTSQTYTKRNPRMTGIERLDAVSSKPLLRPEAFRQSYIVRSPIIGHCKKSSSGTTSDIAPVTKAKPPLYCLPRSDMLRKKKASHTEKTQRMSSAREELNPKSSYTPLRLARRDTNTMNVSGVKPREADAPVTPSSENSLGGGTASLESNSCSSSRVSGALGDSLPKLPELNIISSSESDNCLPDLEEQTEIINVSSYIEERAESNIVENIESKSAGRELVITKIDSTVKSIDESSGNNLDSRLEVCASKDECRNSIESPDSIATNESDKVHDSVRVILCESETNNVSPLSVERDQIRTETTENHEDADFQTTIDVECLLRFLISHVSVLVDSNNSHVGSERANSQFAFPKFDPLDEKLSDNDSEQRIAKMIELRQSLHDSPSSVSSNDNSKRSSSTQESTIDLETRYSWQRVDQVTPNVFNDSDIRTTRSNDQIETKYSWQRIEDRCKDSNDIHDSAEGEESKPNSDGNRVKIHSNLKLTSAEDLCLGEPEYRYSWQKLTSKYLAADGKEDLSANASQPARNIDVNVSINTAEECTKSCFQVRESFARSSNPISSRNVEEKMEAGNDVRRIVANYNSPLNHIISSVLPDIKVITRRAVIDNPRKIHLGSESNEPSARYSSMSGIKHIIAGLNDMLKTRKNLLDSYAIDRSSDKKTDSVEPVSAHDPVEKVEIFPSTLHVLGNYIVRDICPKDLNSPKHFPNIQNNDDTESGKSFINNLAMSRNIACFDNKVERISNKNVPDTNAAVKNTFACDNLTGSTDGSRRSTVDTNSANFPSSLGHRIPLENSPRHSSTFETERDSVLKTSRLLKDYDAETVSSNEIEDGPLLPVLGYDSAPTDNRKARITGRMEQPTESPVDSARGTKGRDDAAESSPYAQSLAPLKPRVRISFSEAKEAGDSNGRENELKSRLESAMSRLKQCERQLDANWNLDYSVLDDEENVSREKKKEAKDRLPRQVEEHIKDIVKSAEEYLAKLEEQLKELRTADEQIINSSDRTFGDIDKTYQVLMDNLCEEINERRNLVRLETEVFKYEGLAPLRACKQEVDAQIRSTQHLIVLTETMLAHPSTFNKDRLGKIITATSHMGRIPAVPMPEELPYVTFSPPNEDAKKDISDRISCMGCVLRMGPAQFTEVCERPACLQLRWQIVDPEFASEEQTFMVQKALGEISEPTSPAFETVYVGPEMSCFVRDLPVDHPITLRVGIQVSDTAWSVHRFARTSVPGYGWDTNNSDYLITNSGRIATKVTRNVSTLLSSGPQFSADHIIEFKFLEAASGGGEEGIGLAREPVDSTESLKRIGALLITPNGNIFIDGEEKLMQLPKMQLGSRIIFTSERKDGDTLRMTIESANKAVTYDWTVQKPLYFAARFFERNKWNFMVK